jgi:hypothetical protein
MSSVLYKKYKTLSLLIDYVAPDIETIIESSLTLYKTFSFVRKAKILLLINYLECLHEETKEDESNKCLLIILINYIKLLFTIGEITQDNITNIIEHVSKNASLIEIIDDYID